MEIIGTVGIIAGAVSIILAIIAMWQALYFFTKGKDTESRVESSLTGIKSQVDALQTIISRITERLTQYVTTPRNDVSESVEQLFMRLRNIPEFALNFTPPDQSSSVTSMRNEITLAYIALWYYTATTNIWTSLCLPSPDNYEENKHGYIKHIVDQSAADFKYMNFLVQGLDQTEIQSDTFLYSHIYREVTEYLLPLIGDTNAHFVRMLKEI